METKLNQIEGLNVLHLRAGYFMENTLPQAGVIHSFGMMAGPVDAEVPLPMIATKDVGAAAADALLKLDFNGKQTQELQGQRNLNYNEAAKIIGEGIGKPGLAYVRLPEDQVIQALSSMGMSKHVATLIVEMANAINRGYVEHWSRDRRRTRRRHLSSSSCAKRLSRPTKDRLRARRRPRIACF